MSAVHAALEALNGAPALITVHVDGRVTSRPLTAPPTLQDVRDALNGGYAEAVIPRTDPTLPLAFADEDGYPKRLHANATATAYLRHPRPLVGPVVLLPGVTLMVRGFALTGRPS